MLGFEQMNSGFQFGNPPTTQPIVPSLEGEALSLDPGFGTKSLTMSRWGCERWSRFVTNFAFSMLGVQKMQSAAKSLSVQTQHYVSSLLMVAQS